MARYPTFEEYTKRGNYKDGIKHCDDLLKRNVNDPQLLTVKLQLALAAGQDGGPILDQLATTTLDVWGIVNVEQAVVASLKDVYPPPLTAGAIVARLWDNHLKATPNGNLKLEILDARFSQAIQDGRLLDAQQALIQMKVLQPKVRTWYMAHAAITQMLSSSKDDLHSRLAISLARKAVSDRFDNDDRKLDCRVPGQIFAIQGSTKDLEIIAGRSFAESKQVYDTLRRYNPTSTNSSDSNDYTSREPSNLPPRDWFIGEVTALKETFRKLVDQDASTNLFIQFISNATRLYDRGINTLGLSLSRGPTDACFLAISGLVKVFAETNRQSCILYSALLAENLLKRNPHVHEARLILVYLYMRLGLGSLAIAIFESLNVKEIQHDTIGHVLLTNISYLHPSSADLPSKGKFEVHERTQKALAMYTRHEEKLVETESAVLRSGQTGMLFDLQLLRDNLRKSLVRHLFLLENRRIARLTSKSLAKIVTDVGPRVSADWINTLDNRDFDATFNYGFNVERTLYSWGNTPSESKWSILNRLLIDSIWALADNHPLLVNDIDVLLQKTEESRHAMSVETSKSSVGSRKAEYLAGCVAISLARLLTKAAAKIAPSQEEFDDVMSKIGLLNIDSLVASTSIMTEFLVDHNIYIDIFHVVMLSCRYIKNTVSPAPTNLQDLETLVKDSTSKLADHARKQIFAIDTTQIKEELLSGMDELHEGLGLIGNEMTTRFCQNVAESAKEGWKGIASVVTAK